MSLTFLPNIEQLSSRVIRILGCNAGTMTLQGTNTYLVGNGKSRILIDASGGWSHGLAGSESDYITALKNELKAKNCQLQEILISHWHQDHTEGVQPILKEITETPVRISKHRLVNNDPEPDTTTKYNYITDMHVFKTDGATLRAIYTPGHTNDHLCFYLEEENALFSGDCVLGETSAEFEDLHDYMRSLQRILDFKPEVIYPGHGPVVKDGVDKIGEYIKHRNRRNAQILEALAKSSSPMEPEDLVRQIYVGLNESLVPAACVNVSNHLESLEKQKLAETTTDGKWIKTSA